MMKHRFKIAACGAGRRATLAPARRSRPPKSSFYYPVAVGGPVTKIIDG